MDQKAKQLLDVFINHAHKSLPTSRDMCHFFDFVIGVHRESLAASLEEVLDLTMEAEFPKHIAVRLATVFGYGVDLLKRYDEVQDR